MNNLDRNKDRILIPDKVKKLPDSAIARSLLYMHRKVVEINRQIYLEGRPSTDLDDHHRRTAAIYREFASRGLTFDRILAIAEGKNGKQG